MSWKDDLNLKVIYDVALYKPCGLLCPIVAPVQRVWYVHVALQAVSVPGTQPHQDTRVEYTSERHHSSHAKEGEQALKIIHINDK